jgi:hypothetical protein
MKTTDLTAIYRALLSLDPEAIKEARRIVSEELVERDEERKEIYRELNWLN